jgi:hypothetical protein
MDSFFNRFRNILREDIKKLLLEALFGKPININIGGENYIGLVSKNTRPGEKPYRITWFEGTSRDNLTVIQPHMQISELEAKEIVETGELPYNVKDQLWMVFGDKVNASLVSA